jgi:hypothetical protein
MKNHKEVLENLIKVVEEEIKDCKRYNKELFKEMNTVRARKYNQVGRLLDASSNNWKNKEKYEQVLEILNTIEF